MKKLECGLLRGWGGGGGDNPEWAERGSKGSLQKPEEHREMKIKTYSDRFTLSYRHYSEKNFKKEDINDHTNKLIISRQFGNTPFNQ